MHLCIVSGILFIVPIIDFALAAPVLVQEKRQACADMADIPEYTITVLPKRGEIEEVGGKYIEKYFVLPKESGAVDGASSSAKSEPSHVSMSAMNAPAPNPVPSTEPNHLLAGMDAPLSSTVYPSYFHPNNELLGGQGSQPITGPLNPDHKLVAEEPLSPTKGSSTESGLEMAPVPPSSQVLSTDPNRQAKGSRRNARTDRDVGNAAQSELQPKRPEALNPGGNVGNL